MLDLNDNQTKAVEHVNGPMLVVAGAGTGKTRVIVDRIAKLVDDGVDKSEILALTFTEKASQEMMDRVAENLNESYGVEIAIHTFNAFGQLLLQEFAVEIGLSNNQKLVGEEGKVVFMREHLDELKLDYFAPVSNPSAQLSNIADYFSKLKQQLVTPDSYLAYATQLPSKDEAEKMERKKHLELANAFGSYISLMRNQNIIDYDDQIYLVVELLKSRPNIQKTLQKRFRHIMVDEFQDTNPMQSELIDLLYDNSSSDGSLMVVGDDDQAIYGWRGATLANILEFTKRYPKAKQVTLIENYRTTQEILDSAWKLIQNNNPNRLEEINKLDKRLKAHRGCGKQPEVVEFEHRDQELVWIAEDIKRRLEKGQDPGSMAVLARSRQLVSDTHKMLNLYEVDHVVAGLGEELFDQPIVVMMIDVLRAIWNPQDNTSLYHTVNSRLFNCDSSVVRSAAHQANIKRLPLISLLKESQDEEVKKAVQKIESWHSKASSTTVRRLSFTILSESGLKYKLYEEAQDDVDVAHQVQALSQWFQSLQDFERISLTPSVLSYLENFPVLRAEGETLHDDTLDITNVSPTVMTIHKSKGLEWQTVYVVGCKTGSFPYLGGASGMTVPDELIHTSEADERLSEERRLMYVATTRAKDELILSFASSSASGKTKSKPSRFIEELGLETTSQPVVDNEFILDHHDSPEPTTVSLPRSMVDDGNVVLSASQAEDYLDCPLNFYYKHVLGVPEEESYQATIGSLYHSIIETINRAKLNGIDVPEYELLLKRLVEEWPEDGYSSQLQRKRDLAHAENDFKNLYDRIVSEPVPVAVEDKFRVHLPDTKCILKGRIDAVMSTNKGVEMRDYKTSTSVTDDEKAKDRTTKSKQLTMYAVAWSLTNGELPEQVSLDFVRTGQIGTVKKMPRSIDNMQSKLGEAAENILAGKFSLGAKHDFCIHP